MHGRKSASYQEILVGGLLPLLGHCGRRRAGEEAEGAKDSETSKDADNGAVEDSAALAGRIEGARAVRTKSDPVRC